MSTDPLPLVTDLALRLMNLYSRLRFCDAMLSRLGVGEVDFSLGAGGATA